LFDFLDELLNGLALSSKEATPLYRSLLPNVHLNSKIQECINKNFLIFLTRLYIATRNTKLAQDIHSWFIEEIAYNLRVCYPGVTKQDYEEILQKIINAIEKENE